MNSEWDGEDDDGIRNLVARPFSSEMLSSAPQWYRATRDHGNGTAMTDRANEETSDGEPQQEPTMKQGCFALYFFLLLSNRTK